MCECVLCVFTVCAIWLDSVGGSPAFGTEVSTSVLVAGEARQHDFILPPPKKTHFPFSSFFSIRALFVAWGTTLLHSCCVVVRACVRVRPSFLYRVHCERPRLRLLSRLRIVSRGRFERESHVIPQDTECVALLSRSLATCVLGYRTLSVSQTGLPLQHLGGGEEEEVLRPLDSGDNTIIYCVTISGCVC